MNDRQAQAFSKTAFPMALAMMRAATSVQHRVWASVICVLLFVLGMFGARQVGDPAQIPLSLLPLLIIGNMTVWSAWFARLSLLQMQCAQACLPGIRHAIARTLLIGAVTTALLPGTLLAIAGADPLHAIGLPALAALLGLLIMLIPWPLAWIMMTALILGPQFFEPLLSRLHPALQDSFRLPVAFPALLAVTGSLVAWRWSSIVRTHEPGDLPRWRRAIVFNHQAGVIESGITPLNPWQTHAGWLSPSPRVDNAGPHDRAGAIGACLGGILGSAAPRDAARQWGLVVVLIVLLLTVPLSDSLISLRDALLCGGVIGLLASGWSVAFRLHRQRQRLSGEFSELSLLPGLGTGKNASEALLRRVLRRLGQLMFFLLVVLSVFSWHLGLSAIHSALMAAMWAGVSAGSLMLCIRSLAGRPVDSTWTLLMMVPLIALVTMTMTIGFLQLPVDRFAVGLFLAWPLVVVLYLAGARLMLRRFRARPHAFLLD